MKFDDFSGLPRGTPDPATRLLGGNAMLFGLQSKTIRPRLEPQTLSTFVSQAPNTLRLCTRHETHWNIGKPEEEPRSRAPKGSADFVSTIHEDFDIFS